MVVFITIMPKDNKSTCGWEGCSDNHYCAELKTWRDDETPHEDNKFCCLAHLAAWAINQGRRERLHRRSGPANPVYLDKIDELVTDLIYSDKYDHMPHKS